MPKQPAPKDLFGKPVKQRRPRYEATLERADKATRPDRAARTRWLAKAIPKGYGFGLPLETVYVLNDAISSFIAGNFVAVIVLSSAFVEHWFTACLSERGYEKEASRGLAASIKLARTHDLVQPAILSKVDRLRLIRNPFVHLKAYDHEHNIGQRTVRKGLHFDAVLEEDAKEAITTMYAVAIHAFRRS